MSTNEQDAERDLSRVREVDIVCEASARAANHPGNRDYAVAVAAHVNSEHPDLQDPEVRRESSRVIVEQFRGQGARFLGRTRRETWKELSEGLAQRWVSQHLRRLSEAQQQEP